MSNRLSAALISSLPDKVERPHYNFENHGVGIIHFGIGAFHRGHQAVFTDDALASAGGDWRILGVSLRSASVQSQLNPQNGLFTVIEKADGHSKARVIASVKEVIAAHEEPQRLCEAFANPDIRIVTISVTEKGYHYNHLLKTIDWDSPEIRHDIAHPSRPKTMPGQIVKACLNRMQRNDEKVCKLTVISCDNLPDNGAVTKSVILSLAGRLNSELAVWIQDNVSFCSSMVDRIVPKVTNEDRNSFLKDYGYHDDGLIVTEPFKQWIIEDNFCTERPDWESAGVLFVNSVSDYEKLKLRTLNCSHSTLAYLGVLLGYEWIHKAIRDPLLLKIIQRLMRNETGPTIPLFTDIALTEYQQQVIERFKNSDIAYSTEQVASDGSQKLQQRIFQVLNELRQTQKVKDAQCLTATIVCWLRYLKGYDEFGKKYVVCDPVADELKLIVDKYWEMPTTLADTLFQQTNIFPENLKSEPTFIENLVSGIRHINISGTHHYLTSIINATE